ncbi:MAG: BON domain-containing protein, partial [Burkholderiales bacterium]|nr:BON domain-containing protein [Burkholderiales bacterium]
MTGIPIFSAARAALAALLLAAAPLVAGAQSVGAPQPSDAEITLAVGEEIFADPVVPYHAVDVETADGVVTLSGRVDNLLAKSRAARLASPGRGARAVVNQLVVVPHQLLTADTLERNVREALRYDPATRAAAIRVQADGLGEVTLGGEVDSYPLRR